MIKEEKHFNFWSIIFLIWFFLVPLIFLNIQVNYLIIALWLILLFILFANLFYQAHKMDLVAKKNPDFKKVLDNRIKRIFGTTNVLWIFILVFIILFLRNFLFNSEILSFGLIFTGILIVITLVRIIFNKLSK